MHLQASVIATWLPTDVLRIAYWAVLGTMVLIPLFAVWRNVGALAAIAADAWHDFGRGFSAGAGVACAAQREDVDAKTFARIDAEDYTVARLYLAWQATPRLALKARAENLLGENYEEVNGYPALGRAVFGGVEWRY